MTDRSTNKQKVRLLFFSFGILEQAGGFEHYLTSTARGLSERYKNLDITIVTMSPKIVEKLQHLFSLYFFKKHNPQAIYREPYETVIQKLGPVKYLQADSFRVLARLLQEGDLLYSKNEVLELAALRRIGYKRLPPVIVGVHTPIFYPHTPSISSRLHNLLYTGPLYRYLITPAQRVHVNNEDDLRLVRTKLGVINARVMRQPFDIPKLRDNTPHPGKLRLLFVGRLTEAKGMDLLTGVVQRLHQLDPDMFIIKIAGAGDEVTVNEITKLARQVPAVEYLGHVQNEAVPELYRWADLTIITSKYETLNKVAIETAMAGKIALSTDIPGPREVIKHGSTGFLLEPNAEAFVHCIARLAQLKKDDPATLKRMGLAAYDYIKAKFNADNAYRELCKEIITTTEGTVRAA